MPIATQRGHSPRTVLPGTLVLLAVSATSAPMSARASGFYITDVGTRGMARAGAFVAAPDSLLAIHYNPAALSLLRGFHAEASVSLVDLDLDYQRRCPCISTPRADAAQLDAMLNASFTPVSSSTPIGIPFVGIGYGFPVLDLTVAFAAYAPNGGRHDWGTLPNAASPAFVNAARSLPQRYSAMQVKNTELNFSLGAALAPLPMLRGLRVGGTITAYRNSSDQTQHLWANSATFANAPEDPRFDVPLDFRFESLAFSWSAGLSWEIIPGLSAGASFRPKRNISAEGTIEAQLPMLLTDVGARIDGNTVDVRLPTAPIGRAGVEYRVPHVFAVEAAVVAEWWSVHDQIVLTPKNITITLSEKSQALNEIVIVRNWRDTYSFRLGGELNLFEPMLGVRAGYFYEPSAVPPERVDASRVDLPKHGLALGLSTEMLGVKLEASAMYVFMESAEITASQAQQKAPLQPPLGAPDYITVIGNGSYQGHYLIGSVSLAFALDRVALAD